MRAVAPAVGDTALGVGGDVVSVVKFFCIIFHLSLPPSQSSADSKSCAAALFFLRRVYVLPMVSPLSTVQRSVVIEALHVGDIMDISVNPISAPEILDGVNENVPE